MTKIRSWMFVAALVLGGSSSALAQSVCPTTATDKISISGVNLTDGASYEIYFGNRTGAGGAVAALVKRNGTCLGVKSVSKNGTVLGSQLPSGVNNVCFGGAVDVVTLMSSSLTFSTCTGSPTLNAFNHGGNKITLYGAGGADRFFGGPGTEIFWGSSGIDTLTGTSGNSDELYGENDGDQISGSSGATTWIDGGAGADTIQDTSGFWDVIIGGSGNDFIDASCNDAVSIDCGLNTDTVWHETHGGGEPFGWGCETVNHATWC